MEGASRKHQFWEPKLSPPPLLDGVVVVLVSPRRPVSLGTTRTRVSPAGSARNGGQGPSGALGPARPSLSLM